jgi:hypothetical protein
MAVLLAPVLWRPGVVFALIEVPLLAAVAATAFFFGGLVMKRAVDGALFFSRASFATMAVVEPGSTASGAHEAVVLPRFPVVRAPGPGGSLEYTPELQTVEVDVVESLDPFVRDVLGTNVVAGSAVAGALVDEDTAIRLGVGMGDSIVLDGAVLGAHESPGARVVGLLRPYTSPRNPAETGLVVVAQPLVSQGFVEEVAGLLPAGDQPVRRIYDADPPTPGSVTRDDVVAVFMARLVGADAVLAVIGILAFAGILWLAAIWRGVEHAVGRSIVASAVLVALGSRPAAVRWAALGPHLLLVVSAQLVGAAVASLLLFPQVLGATLQPAALAPMFVVLTVCTALVFAVALAGVRGSLQVGSLLATLGRDDA